MGNEYFKINEWQQAGLDKQSYVDTNVVRDLPPSALAGKTAIGKLTESDVQKLLEFLLNTDGAWHRFLTTTELHGENTE